MIETGGKLTATRTAYKSTKRAGFRGTIVERNLSACQLYPCCEGGFIRLLRPYLRILLLDNAPFVRRGACRTHMTATKGIVITADSTFLMGGAALLVD